MDEPGKKFACKLREIATQVHAWENRDLKESGANSRPGYYVDLEKIASILEGNSSQYRCDITPRQNWPGTLEKLCRDFEIAEFVHQYRIDPKLKVKDGILAATEKFRSEGVDMEAVRRANRLYGRFFRDGNSDAAFMMQGLRASRLGKLKRGKKAE